MDFKRFARITKFSEENTTLYNVCIYYVQSFNFKMFSFNTKDWFLYGFKYYTNFSLKCVGVSSVLNSWKINVCIIMPFLSMSGDYQAVIDIM